MSDCGDVLRACLRAKAIRVLAAMLSCSLFGCSSARPAGATMAASRPVAVAAPTQPLLFREEWRSRWHELLLRNAPWAATAIRLRDDRIERLQGILHRVPDAGIECILYDAVEISNQSGIRSYRYAGVFVMREGADEARVAELSACGLKGVVRTEWEKLRTMAAGVLQADKQSWDSGTRFEDGGATVFAMICFYDGKRWTNRAWPGIYRYEDYLAVNEEERWIMLVDLTAAMEAVGSKATAYSN